LASIFLHDDEYFEYLLENLGYLDENMFIMKRIGRCEVSPNVDQYGIRTYNQMHVGYRMSMEWGIGGLKRKWRQLMKRFDSTTPKYIVLFKVTTILTNFLHGHQMEFTFEVCAP
jgi:hypothetical protein